MVWIIISLVLLALSLSLGFRALAANPYLLDWKQKLVRIVASLAAGFGLFLLVGSFLFVSSAPPPSPARPAAPAPPAAPLVWHEDLAAARKLAAEQLRPLLVDAWAAWCKPCKKLFDNVLSHDSLRPRLSRFVLAKIDTEDERNAAFVKERDLGEDLPWIGFFAPDGRFAPDLALSGEKGAAPFSSPPAFAKALDKALAALEPPPSGWLTSLDEGLAASASSGRPLLVDAWAVWCTACVEFRHSTLEDPKVEAVLAGWVRVALDMDAPANEPVWERLAIKGLPYIARFPAGETTPAWVLHDTVPTDAFLARLASDSAGESQDIAAWLAGKGLLLTVLLVFLAGILASLTPCAYPSYILMMGFFAGERGDQSSRPPLRTSILAAAAIVLGMVASYSAAGLAAALGGGAVGRLMSNPFVMGAIALLFLFMGASSLSVLPPMEFAALKGRLQSRQKRNLLWAFIFGLVMGLVVAPCVGPVLIAIITYIATTGSATIGTLLMAAFALGMGVLLFALALFSHTLKSRVRMGPWSEAISVLFGILFFAVAFYYLKGVLPYERLFALVG
jgi:thiol:disulfide interchange protein